MTRGLPGRRGVEAGVDVSRVGEEVTRGSLIPLEPPRRRERGSSWKTKRKVGKGARTRSLMPAAVFTPAESSVAELAFVFPLRRE